MQFSISLSRDGKMSAPAVVKSGDVIQGNAELVTEEKAFMNNIPYSGSGWNSFGWSGWPTIDEPYTGAWQNNDELRLDTVVNNPTVFACVTLISNDIGTLRNKLVEELEDGRTVEIKQSGAFLPVLTRPNRYQNHIQFKEWWIMSKCLRGNAYALKQRDNRGVVTGLYLLDPCMVVPLVSDDGDIFYQLSQDNLNGLTSMDITVPASEIIHDRWNCLFHPLVGLSPLFAAGVVAGIGLKIIRNSAFFFGNNSIPSGVLVAPGPITKEKALFIKEQWSSGYTGANAGRTAILGDGMKFEPMRMTAADSQMLELLRWTDEKIAACFHVPAYKVGVGPMPAINNTGTLAQEYYNECLRPPIEEYELCMTEGLGLDVPKEGKKMSVELDLTGLFRMDYKNQVDTLGAGVEKKILTLNDARLQLNLPPLTGGDTVYMQQQDYPLDVIKDNILPVVSQAPALPADPVEPDPAEAEEEVRSLMLALRKNLELS
jgi:HK97 family phage portal protein